MVQLLTKKNVPVHIHSIEAGREFELGTPEYRSFVYQKLLCKIPTGTPVILSDDSAVWAAATALYRSYPVIGVLHADEPHYYNLAKQHYSRVSVFACVSERVHRHTLRYISQASPAIISVIPCGINLPPEPPRSNTPHILQLAYVGRITEYQKRTGDLVKIATGLRDQNIAFHLHIVGDGTDRGALEEAFTSGELRGMATFHGWLQQSDVNKRLSVSDVLILTSDFEGTPIAMMEALAAGCAVVGTRVSGIEDYEHNPLAADCYAVFDVGDIAEAVKQVRMITSKLPAVRRESARKLAECEFSMDICIERYAKAINSIQGSFSNPERVRLSLMALISSRALAAARYLKATLTKGK